MPNPAPPPPPPPPPPSLQIPEFVGNIGDLRLLRESLHLRIPGAFPDDDTHQLVQASPTGEPWIFTTIAWSALSGLYLWVSGVPVSPEQGGANTPLNSPGPSPIHTSEGGYVAFDASHKPGGVQIGDAIGNLATSDLADGATNEQDFGDIGPNLLTFLQGKPRDTASANVPPGGTYIGRTIGNLRTGQIGTNAVSKQTFGKSQVSFGTANSQSTRSPTDVGSDKESSRAGFSIINSRVSAVNFPPASRGRTLGEQLSTTAVCG